MNTFRPSIDWSHEAVNSAVWVLQVWVITALGTWILGVLIIKRWWGRWQQSKAARA